MILVLVPTDGAIAAAAVVAAVAGTTLRIREVIPRAFAGFKIRKGILTRRCKQELFMHDTETDIEYKWAEFGLIPLSLSLSLPPSPSLSFLFLSLYLPLFKTKFRQTRAKWREMNDNLP